MQTIVLLFSTATGLFFVGFFSKAGKRRDDFLRRKKQLGETAISNRTEELSKPLTERILLPIRDKCILLLSKAKITSREDSKSNLRNERLLRQAGVSISALGFQQFKIILTALCVPICGILGVVLGQTMLHSVLFLLIGFILSLLMPSYYVKAKAKSRSREMRQALPDVMDMLTVCVEAGLGLDGAIIKIGEKNKNAMTEEMMTTIKEVQFGRLRRDAFKDLGDRNDVAELKTFAAAMIQGEKYGVPIKGILKAQANKLRESRKQAAQEKAMRSPVKIMIPIVVFIFPVIFIILMGPSVINIMDMMKW